MLKWANMTNLLRSIQQCKKKEVNQHVKRKHFFHLFTIHFIYLSSFSRYESLMVAYALRKDIKAALSFEKLIKENRVVPNRASMHTLLTCLAHHSDETNVNRILRFMHVEQPPNYDTFVALFKVRPLLSFFELCRVEYSGCLFVIVLLIPRRVHEEILGRCWFAGG